MNTSLNRFVLDPNVIAQRTISSHMQQKVGDLNKRLTSPKRLHYNCVLQMKRVPADIHIINNFNNNTLQQHLC